MIVPECEDDTTWACAPGLGKKRGPVVDELSVMNEWTNVLDMFRSRKHRCGLSREYTAKMNARLVSDAQLDSSVEEAYQRLPAELSIRKEQYGRRSSARTMWHHQYEHECYRIGGIVRLGIT